MADHSTHAAPPPLTPGLLPNLKFDLLSGFLVFLIAMPLCLGIAKACNYPPIAGIWTAVIGGLLTGFLSNSQLTIKGPAAGLIVIVEGAVLELGAQAAPPGSDLATQIQFGYPLALGVGVTAGVIQILFGLVKAAKIGEIVPLTPVHGMLAAIGITIMAKSMFVVIGVSAPPGAPIDAIAAIPATLAKTETMKLRETADANEAKGIADAKSDEEKQAAKAKADKMRNDAKKKEWSQPIAAIGLTSLAILIAFPFLKARIPALKPVPAQVVVLAVGIPMASALSLTALGESVGNPMQYLVAVPDVIPAVFDNFKIAFMLPDFSGLATGIGIKYVVLFSLIASIESMLSSQAIDMIDPWQRKTDQNKDLLAVGLANTLCSAIGALPMISEIVRSKANIDNGARTKYANMFHGIFLLAFVLMLPFVIRMIPLAALGAMLVYTGFRLASPKEFVHTYKIGIEQLIVFVTTIVVVLCTDLLVGVISGILLKLIIHMINGAPLSSFLRADIEVASTDDDKVVVLKVRKAAVFANWLSVKNAILKQAEGRDEIVLDLTETTLVDHSTMEKLHQLEFDLGAVEKRLRVIGLETHTALSSHPLAARKSSSHTHTHVGV
ncbi:MAG: SulP family inorganic anion transporter [Planctomycetes bacterium]|nr:SulP family inorganic anion transporter [Planctomycetota bacterium]